MRDWNREVLVDRIVECFADMGGGPESLKVERSKLLRDDPYLESWQKVISLKPEPLLRRLKRSFRVRVRPKAVA